MARILLIITIILLSACGNDLTIQAPYNDIPVVYSILNQNDSVHYVRLEKSFAGEMNAFDMAAIPDSIYYPDAEVKIEKWRDGEFREEIIFNEVDTISRDSGIFAYKTNRVFAARARLDGEAEYRLRVNIPGKEDTITARTHLVDRIRIIKPPYTQPTLNFSQYTGEVEVEWKSAPYARVYFLQVRFNYFEVFNRDTMPKSLIWRIAHYVSDHSLGNETMEARINHEQFYRWLPSKIEPASPGIKRIANKKAFDFLFTIGGEELYTYMQIYDPDDGITQDKPIFTNISGGIGIFSARYEQELNGKALTFPSIDSLSRGIYTKSLGFVDSTDDYYNKQ